MKAGVSLNPATPVHTIEDVIDDLDLLLIMTVNPGFGGQKFIRKGLHKIKQARQLIDASGKDILLEVDGGVNTDTVKEVTDSGANLLVAGSAIFSKPDIVQAMNSIRASTQD